MARLYLIFSTEYEQWEGSPPHNAPLIEVCETEAEAHEFISCCGPCACYSYQEDGFDLVDERLEFERTALEQEEE